MENTGNIKIILEYDGTAYHGWQSQKNALTIQDVLEDKISMITDQRITLNGSGRTDAGVHALHQVCNFHTQSKISPESLRLALNSLLPPDIHIKSTEYVSHDFHSRYSAKSKVYEYRTLNRREPDIFSRNYTWHIKEPMYFEEMERCLNILTGRHDFSAFRSSGSGNINPVRNLIYAGIEIQNDSLIIFRFEAEGFLRHMVRNIMGTLIDVGKGKKTYTDFERIFYSADRQKAGVKAPPQGLFLVMVKY